MHPLGRIYASLNNAVVTTADGGTTWSTSPFNTFSGSNTAVAIASAANTPSMVLAASGSSIYRSTDGGTTWALSNGLAAGASATLLLASASNNNVFYALVAPNSGSGFTVYASSDGGMNWAQTAAQPTGTINNLFIDPSNDQVLYSTNLAQRISRTSNGGASWTVIAGRADGIAVDPQHSNILFSSYFDGVTSRSIDTGATWEALPAQSGGINVSGHLQIDPVRPYRVLVGTFTNGAYEISIEPDLSVQVNAPGSPSGLGVAQTWTYTVKNNGPYNATGVALSLGITGTATAISATSSAGSCSISGGTETCALGSLLTGNSVTVTLQATPTIAEAFTVTATVSGDQPDSVPTNNSTSSTLTVEPLADLSVAQSGPGSGTQGTSATYTVAVTNLGPNTASSAQLSYQVPSFITVTSATTSASGGNCTVATPVTCTLGNLSSGATATVTVNVQLTNPGGGSVVATVSSPTTDLVTSNNTVSNSISVDQVADLSVSDSGPGNGDSGMSATYALTVKNAGPDTATATQLSYQVPSFATATAATTSATGGTCTAAATVSCSLGDLASGASVTVTVTLQLANAGTGNLVATVSSTSTDPVSSNNTTSTALVVVTPPPPTPSAGGKSGGGALSPLTLLGLLLACFCRFGRITRS